MVELVDLSISSAYDASCDICIMAVMFVRLEIFIHEKTIKTTIVWSIRRMQ